MIYFDTESVGLVGPTVLIQYGYDQDGPIHLHHVFEEPLAGTLKVIRQLAENPVCGFNLTHDWFHIQRLHNVVELLLKQGRTTMTVEGWYDVLRAAVHGPCVKPPTALDLMLYARQGPMQSLMERDDVRLRRIPRILAEPLAEHLTRNLDLPAIYFARFKEGGQWKVKEDPDDPEFPDVVLSFGAEGGLKPLARHLLGAEGLEFPIPEEYKPKEKQWNPFQIQPMELVYYHVAYWQQNENAQRYAREDVEHLRGLHKVWDFPPPGDTNSVLACAVGSCRWRGWAVNHERLEKKLAQATKEAVAAPTSPSEVKEGLTKLCSDVELLAINDTTGETLEMISKWDDGKHPASDFCKRVIRARTSEKQVNSCEKLKVTQRAHFDFKVSGTLSDRMAGGSKFNPQAVDSELRDLFTMADETLPDLDGGDFDQFEVALACAAYNDADLTAALKSGKKLHGLFGAAMYEQDYDTVVRSAKKEEAELKAYLKDQGLGWEGDLYNPSKHGVFTTLYGGQGQKLADTMKIALEQAERGINRLKTDFPGIKIAQDRIAQNFCSMRQPGGLGTKVYWHEPAEYIESLFGGKRWFTLENKMCRTLFDLAEDPPEYLVDLGRDIKVRRRDKVQRADGAVRSALFGAAFQIQARNMRAATNHEIQASGAKITKELQVEIWGHQPWGICPWAVQPWNIHDEVEATRVRTLDLRPTVSAVIERFRKRVPLLAMTWRVGIPDWGVMK